MAEAVEESNPAVSPAKPIDTADTEQEPLDAADELDLTVDLKSASLGKILSVDDAISRIPTSTQSLLKELFRGHFTAVVKLDKDKLIK